MILRKVEKISRNQKPCKCGKDIKYKYCCGKVENNYVKPPTKKPKTYTKHMIIRNKHLKHLNIH